MNLDEMDFNIRNASASSDTSIVGVTTVHEGTSIEFPLPPQTNEALCRDKFLEKLLKPYVGVIEKQDEIFRLQSFYLESNIEVEGEGLGILKWIQAQNQRKTEFVNANQFRSSLKRPELEVLYKNCLYQFQNAAIQFLMVRLKKQIDTILKIWPGEIVEVPHKLFYWSVEHFKNRSKVSELYLDVLPKERSQHDLDCAKFCTDLNEIIRLLEAIKTDFCTNQDICKSSLVMLNDSNYEYTSTWVMELAELRKKYKKISKIAYTSSQRAAYEYTAEVMAENNTVETLMQIELRYRVNWLRSCGEQTLMCLQAKEQVYLDEIAELQKKILEDSATFKFVDFIDQYQIDNYRSSIIRWQEKLETDQEAAELEVNIKRAQLIKARDDLKFCKEQVIMFRQRVAEVLALIALEERSSSRRTRSTKGSLGSRKSRKSSALKAAKNKNKK